MQTKKQKRMSTETMVLGAILTALVVVLQYLGQFIRLGPFSISLVLLPIVIGAATCGVKIGAWLGLVFGAVVLITGDAAAFLAINVPGTVATVLLKGTACGLVAGLAYKAVEKKNRYAAVVVAALLCPIVNTGIFLLGCVLFFFETIEGWGLAEGYGTAVEYMFLGLAGGNFLVELAINIVLSPVVVRLLNIKKKNK
ncbi:MAG: ECF transporter S component [Clostridia bacterium]|nr:ECF transporter S component [Clostridia bacterium]MBQ7100354.1 ECF transporter S component [Clostridia bacterium]